MMTHPFSCRSYSWMSGASQEVGDLAEEQPAVELALPTAGGTQLVVADMPALNRCCRQCCSSDTSFDDSQPILGM